MVNKTLLIAWIASFIALCGSLYFSEIMGFTPCTLCWYQRILMYPLVALLGIAFYRNDKKIYIYILPLSILGMLLAGYHYTLQKFPIVSEFSICSDGIPCSGAYINWFGFITIPFMALVAFTIITLSMIVLYKSRK